MITSGGYRSVPVGTAIPQTELGTRTFSDARRGVALATIKGEIFASTSKDGGRRWTVASPVLFAPAANSEMGVSQVSLKGPVTYFAWGGGGSAVDVTTDGGKRWWRAFLGGSVLSVTVNGAELAAVVQDESAHATSTVIYVSADGRHWAIAPHLAVG